jgi:hypothetical protein
MLPSDELEALAADIAENGLLDPITVDGTGTVLDGRNRLTACELAKVEPHFVIHDGDPFALILSKNAHRRHMSTGARAMATAKVLAAAGARENGRWKRGTVDNGPGSDSEWPKAMQRAGTVLDTAPELADAVVKGSTTLREAHDTAKRRKEAAQSTEARLIKLAEDHPDLAEKVRNDELTVDGAIAEGRERITQWGQMNRAGEAAAERIAQQMPLDVNEIVIAAIAPRNTLRAWATPAVLDIPALIDALNNAITKLEDCK